LNKTFFLENCHELNEIYCIALYRILKEIRFPQLKIFFEDSNKDLVGVSDVTTYIFLIFNSQEVINEGFYWSEEAENVIYSIISHIASLFARDLATRSHQSTGAKNFKQKLDPEDPYTQELKPTIANFFPNSVIIMKKVL
jgi:hypothetical protein